MKKKCKKKKKKKKKKIELSLKEIKANGKKLYYKPLKYKKCQEF